MKIKSIHTENLKKLVGVNNITLNGQSANVFMENRGGKTTATADAISWLLFDKDSVGNSKPDLTPVINGIPQHDLETTVEAVFILPEGAEVTLKKVYKALFGQKGKKKGQLLGHTTDHYINGDYKDKKADYDAVVSEIASPKTFRLLTDPLYFNNPDTKVMPWKERRDIILQMAGVSEEEIKGNDSRVKTLKKEKSEAEKALTAKQSEITGAKKNIGEVQASIAIDVPLLRTQLRELQEQRLSIANGGDVPLLKQQIAELDTALLTIKNKHTEKIQEQVNAIQFEKGKKANTLGEIEAQISQKRRNVAMLLEEEKALKEKLEELREQWKTFNSWTFETNGVYVDTCPTCGQSLPEDIAEESRKAFNIQKSKSLEENVAKGKETAAKITECQGQSTAITKEINSLNSQLPDLQAKAEEYQKEITKLQNIKVESLPEYKETQEKRQALSVKLGDANQAIDTTEIDQQIADTQAKIDEAEKIAATIEARKQSLEGIKKMEAEEKELAGKLEDKEQELDTLNKAILEQALSLETTINDMFEFIGYRMFETTIDGEVNECCVCVNKQGVAYDYFSRSERIRAGMDSIRQLQKLYGLDMPVFIDDRDLISELPYMGDTQVISNYVSPEDKKLRVELI